MHRLLFIAILFLFSCSQPNKQIVKEPDDLIPQEKMANILAEVHLLEATLGIRSSPMPQMRSHLPMEFSHDSISIAIAANPENKKPLPYYDIFKRLGVTEKQYEESMAWYSSDPEKLNDLYDAVIVELTKRQTQDRGWKSSDSLKK